MMSGTLLRCRLSTAFASAIDRNPDIGNRFSPNHRKFLSTILQKKKKKRKQQQKWKWNHFEYLRRRHFLAIVFILLSCSLFSSMWGTRIDDLSTSTCASTNEYVYCSCSSMSSPIMLKFILLFSRYNLRHMPCIFFDNSTLESGYDYYRYWWLLFVQQNRMDIILLKFANRILDFVISLR